MLVHMVVNDRTVAKEVPPGTTLLAFVRGQLDLTGTKGACGRGECGACTVLVGDRAVMSCVLLAAEVSGPVTTIEGLVDDARDLREAFADHYGFQCGYCTAGQIVRGEAVLRATERSITRREIRDAMSGNICRCTGYAQIVDAVARAAAERELLDESVGRNESAEAP